MIYFREGGEGRCLELEGFVFEIHADRIQTGPGFRVSLSSSPPVPRKTDNMHNWGEGGEDGRNEDPELAGSDYVSVI